MKQIPGILIAAPKSGAGKTMITCGILKALQEDGLSVASFKCGPDYIDPMFHAQVLGKSSYNLDSFLCGEEKMRSLYALHSAGADLSVVEGVMGYYDGLGGTSRKASTWETAMLLHLPAVMVVDAREEDAVIPQIRALLDREEESRIKGVILNRQKADTYETWKQEIESAFPLSVFGYVPEMESPMPGSRYLGLKLPFESPDFSAWAGQMGAVIKATVDLSSLVALGRREALLIEDFPEEESRKGIDKPVVRIGLARDEAFCFFYEDNLRLLREMGAEIVPFSPINDLHLPENIDGLLLCGGYPELHAQALSENKSMRREIKEILMDGLPCIAECGGFMYLQEELRTKEGASYAMCGVLPGESANSGHLNRFGYIHLSGGTVFGQKAGDIRAHEYHYWDSSVCGDAFTAVKPLTGKSWHCMISTDTIFAGYPHINYIGNEEVAKAFLTACLFRKERQKDGSDT